jgi:signal transduction histidine kinase
VVSDQGEGIPDKDKVLIFNRFQRLAEKKKAVKGSGLGLAIAKRIVDLHGGSIGVEDNPSGKGSSFWATVKKA